MSQMSRRNILLGTGAALLAGMAALPATALPRAPEHSYSAVVVDVNFLRDRGYGIQADWVEKDLVRALKRQFNHRLVRNAPRLLVELKGVSLGDYAGGDKSVSDFLEGDVLVVDKGGKVEKRQPILLALSPMTAGAWYLQDIDRRRITALCDTFASWVDRYTR